MTGVLSQNGSHFRAGDREAKRTVFLALPSSLASAWFADEQPALFSEIESERKKVLAFQEVED